MWRVREDGHAEVHELGSSGGPCVQGGHVVGECGEQRIVGAFCVPARAEGGQLDEVGVSEPIGEAVDFLAGVGEQSVCLLAVVQGTGLGCGVQFGDELDGAGSEFCVLGVAA